MPSRPYSPWKAGDAGDRGAIAPIVWGYWLSREEGRFDKSVAPPPVGLESRKFYRET